MHSTRARLCACCATLHLSAFALQSALCSVIMPPRTPIVTSRFIHLDGRSPNSIYWGPRTKIVKMCPHVRPRGGPLGGDGQRCGLDAEHCMCMCLLCGAPMRARRVCGALLADNTRCPWGANRSPDNTSPEASPEKVKVPRRVVWYKDPAPPKPGPTPSLPRGMCLPNLEPGGPNPPMPTITKSPRMTKKVRPSILDFTCFDITPTHSPPQACGQLHSCSTTSHNVEQVGVQDPSSHFLCPPSSPL
jgi:hypothetical protein